MVPCAFIKSRFPTNKLILYFHGNAEDIGFANEFLAPICEKWKVDLYVTQVHALAIEYPGYGLYPGNTDGDSIKATANLVYDFVTRTMRIPPQDIIIFGRSIGTGPATYLANRSDCSALVLFSPYISIRGVAKEHVGCLSCCAPDIFQNIEAIRTIRRPIFIIHGKLDEVINVKNADALFEACHTNSREHKDIRKPEHMTHNDFFLEDDFIAPSTYFLESRKLIKQIDTRNHQIPEAIADLRRRFGPRQLN